MNCCNDYGKCTGAHGCPARAECSLPCSAPPAQQRYPFAPGVIDHGDHHAGSRLETALSILLALAFAAALAALAATLGFMAGYINAGGLLP